MATVKFLTPAHAEADALLVQKLKADRELQELAEAVAEAVEEVRQTWTEQLEAGQAAVHAVDLRLQELCREHRLDLFGDPGRAAAERKVDLPHGFLALSQTKRLVRPRKANVLAVLERYGFEEAIKRSAAVDWEELDENWDDEALTILGLHREVKTTYAYEAHDKVIEASKAMLAREGKANNG